MAQKVLMGSRNLEVMAEVTWSYCICLWERKIEVLSWAGFDVIILSPTSPSALWIGWFLC